MGETAGLFYLEEINKSAYCADWSAWVSAAYPCVPGQLYYGRGAKQLSWNYNYGAFSQAMFGDARILLEQPDLVASTWLNFASSMWFYVTPQPPKPSMLQVVEGDWTPNSVDQANLLEPGFGATTMIINGALECGPSPSNPTGASNRANYYTDFAGRLGVDIAGEKLTCSDSSAFSDAGSAGSLTLFWAPENGCSLVKWQTAYSALVEGDYAACNGEEPDCSGLVTGGGGGNPSPLPPTVATVEPVQPGQSLVTGDCVGEGTVDGEWNDDWGCDNANACERETACLDRVQGIADYCQNGAGEQLCATFTSTGSSKCVGEEEGCGGETNTGLPPATPPSPGPTVSPGPVGPTPAQCVGETQNYGEALRLSLLFYEAQRSGELPSDNRVPWRGDSSLGDIGNNGEDLTGGYHDAGDYVKFGFPMAGAMTILAYGGISYASAYEAAGQMEYLKDAIKWGTDYIIKAHVSPNEFYCQVGNGVIDHEYPGRPETMTVSRPAYSLTPSKPGSDCIGESATALASAAVLFAESDPTYSATLVEHAEQLFEFANTNKGLYSSSISDAGQFYRSDSYEDELIWAAAWLYKATEDSKYLEKAEDLYAKRTQTWTSWSFDWADKLPGAQLLLFELTGKTGYKTDVEAFCDAARAGIKSTEYRDYAASQINYMLGDNPNNFSYVVGYGDSFPKQPHHKAAACASLPAECTWATFSDTSQDNPHQLNGALVGGPSAPDDSYQDDRTDYIMAEVTLDYNAGFQSTVAGLKSFSC